MLSEKTSTTSTKTGTNKCSVATKAWGRCCYNAQWRGHCLEPDASPLVFTQNFAELLVSRLAGFKIEDVLLMVCVPAEAYWKHLICVTVHRATGRAADVREVKEQFARLTEKAGVRPATAARTALKTMHLTPPMAASSGLGLIAGDAGHTVVLWGFAVQAEPSGWAQRGHRAVRRAVRTWGQTASQAQAAALPASLALICSLVASTVSLASSQLVTGQLHKVAQVLLGSAFTPSVARQLAKEGVYYASFFVHVPGKSWEDLRKVLSLFLVPNVLALLRGLFPRAAASNASTVQLMLVSTGEVLRELMEGGPKLISLQQDLASAFAQHVASLGFLQGTSAGADVRAVGSVATKIQKGLWALRDAKSPATVLKGVFSLAGTVLFAYRDNSVMEVARRANVMMRDLVTAQATHIWADARLATLHPNATKAAWASGRGALLTWDVVSNAEAMVLGANAPQALAGARAILDALSKGYVQELREGLDATCADARERLALAAHEWVRTGEQLLFPVQVKDAADAVLRLGTATAVRAMAHCESCAEGAGPWPDLFVMDSDLAFEVDRQLRASAPSSTGGGSIEAARVTPVTQLSEEDGPPHTASATATDGKKLRVAVQ